jgi:hypothetical protein
MYTGKWAQPRDGGCARFALSLYFVALLLLSAPVRRVGIRYGEDP